MGGLWPDLTFELLIQEKLLFLVPLTSWLRIRAVMIRCNTIAGTSSPFHHAMLLERKQEALVNLEEDN